jgi:hypothetical protein
VAAGAPSTSLARDSDASASASEAFGGGGCGVLEEDALDEDFEYALLF